MKNKISMAGFLVQSFRSLIFPDICAICDTAAAGEELELGVCQSCWSGIREIGPHVCFRCGVPLGSEEPGKSFKEFKCADCRDKKTNSYTALRSLFYYQSPLREIFHLFKFQGFLPVGEKLAGMLAGAMKGNPFMADVDLVIPVPLHLFRQLKRGFNQSGILAARIAAELGLSLEERAMERMRNTLAQSTLDTDKRGGNLKGAFSVKANLVKKKRVLLVDDVVTTGTTIKECCRSLKRAGAVEVKVITLARAESL